jgi:hypothetical protein
MNQNKIYLHVLTAFLVITIAEGFWGLKIGTVVAFVIGIIEFTYFRTKKHE